MGRPAIDLTGMKFDRLTVLNRDETKPSGAGKSVYWNCQCECGNIKSVRMDKLRKGEVRSCGCLSKEIRTQIFLKDLKNQDIGYLHVLERDKSKPIGKGCYAYWTCKCRCGNIVSVRGDHLRDGTTQSCGCLNSSGELLISTILQENNISYTTQYSFPDLKGDYNALRFDFAIFNEDKTLSHLIEYQGEQHYKPWGNEDLDRFCKRLEYDNKKVEYCKNNNIPLIIISFDKQNITMEDLLL